MQQALPQSAVVAVVGAGAMGAGIAQIAAQAGHRVRLLDLQPGAAAQAINRIREALGRLVEKGKLTTQAAADISERLVAVESHGELAGASLVVEAIVERLDVKRQLFTQLEAFVDADCILATNTSSISITAIAAGLQHPSRVIGMHFFNPAPVMALVEVVSGLATDARVAAVVYDTARAWGKKPVHAKSTPGFIVNRVARPFYGEALRLLHEQASDPATLDAVMREGGGFRMGPFELMDLIGHDVNFAVTCSVFEAMFNDPRFAPSLIQRELVNAGRLGRKSGQGFYDHAPGAVMPAPMTEARAVLPHGVAVWTGSPLGSALAQRLSTAGLHCQLHDTGHVGSCLLRAGEAVVFLTDGRSATQRAVDIGHSATVLADLPLDASRATRVALAAADSCGEAAYRGVVAVFQAAGFAVSRLADVPGLAVMRTVAMLANEAADAVNQGVCEAQAADTAMQHGVNYPRGPLTWADDIGLDHVLRVLDHLARVYGEDRYRASPLLRRLVAGGRRFHTA